MRRGSWIVVLCFPVSAEITAAVAWGAKEAWIFDHGWSPPAAWLLGIALLVGGRPVVAAGDAAQLRRSRWTWATVGYAVTLGLVGPMLWVQANRHAAPWFVLLLAPLAWVGVTGPGRGDWARGVGAWLVLYGQFFALIYNVTHGDSGIGCWSGWVY